MKILVVCQYYYPEPFRISDICEELVKRGHKVTVVTGVPNYPEGVIYDDYKRKKRRREIINGVEVHRCFTIGRRTGTVFRFLNYYSYAISSWLHINGLKKSFDVVLVNQLSPVMMAYAGIRAKKKWNIPLVMYCLDLWPESLVTGGVEKDSLVYKIFYYISRKIYHKADKILITSRMFAKYFENRIGISLDKIEYLPQYAEAIFDKKKQQVEKDTIDLTFAGNVGIAQSVDTIVKAATILKEKYKNLCWHIVGGGSELEKIKSLADKCCMKNVIFHGRKPIEEMPTFYAMSDAMLVTMKDEPIISMTLPGKVQSYMAAGKPIIGAINGETKEILKDAQCGFCSEAEDAEGLAQCVEQFIKCEDKIKLGENARAYYEKYFVRHEFMVRLESYLMRTEEEHENINDK